MTEANKLGMPVVAVVDTNCDPDLVTHVIPGNDDAIRAGALLCRVVADAVVEGRFMAEQRPSAPPTGAVTSTPAPPSSAPARPPGSPRSAPVPAPAERAPAVPAPAERAPAERGFRRAAFRRAGRRRAGRRRAGFHRRGRAAAEPAGEDRAAEGSSSTAAPGGVA